MFSFFPLFLPLSLHSYVHIHLGGGRRRDTAIRETGRFRERGRFVDVQSSTFELVVLECNFERVHFALRSDQVLHTAGGGVYD